MKYYKNLFNNLFDEASKIITVMCVKVPWIFTLENSKAYAHEDEIEMLVPKRFTHLYSIILTHEMGHVLLKHNYVAKTREYLKNKIKWEMDAWIAGLKWSKQYGFKITPYVIHCVDYCMKTHGIDDKTLQLFKDTIKKMK